MFRFSIFNFFGNHGHALNGQVEPNGVTAGLQKYTVPSQKASGLTAGKVFGILKCGADNAHKQQQFGDSQNRHHDTEKVADSFTPKILSTDKYHVEKPSAECILPVYPGFKES